jgi:flagellar protein FliL
MAHALHDAARGLEQSMAKDNEEEEEIGEAPAKKKAGRGRVIAIAVGANAALLGIAIVVMKMTMAPPHPEAAKPQAGQKQPEKEAHSARIGPLVDVDGFIVNIPGEDGNHYLKASVAVELESESAKSHFEEKMQVVRNEVLMYLSGLSLGSTRSVKQKRDIEHGLKKLLNARLGDEIVAGAYFTEFVTQ